MISFYLINNSKNLVIYDLETASVKTKKGEVYKIEATDYKLKPKVKEFLEGFIGLYINGEYVRAVNGKTFEVLNLVLKK